ncbi:DUF6090 family protein [Gaetbulibacter aestuarii]|uniref:DUF6090 family protein n=1 Tax=Gaetbulibacter aestuarii TaxID=1502358 RepID=A0ABW7MUL1_9FLAO
MMKFFRKIRQNLISQGKVVNYVKYAIGEIALVVIGILIALQVNNWNENKKNVIQAKKHLETVKLNLEDDMQQAKRLLSETQTTIDYSNDFLDQFKTLKPVDNNVQMYLIYLMFERNLEINESGINALLNSNGMSFIDDSLQAKLLNYYRYIEQLKSRELNANTEIKTMYEPYVKEHFYWIYNKTNPWHRQAAYYKDDPRKPHIDLESVIADKRLEIMVMNRRYQCNLIADFYTNTINLSKEIIHEIEDSSK